VPGRDLVVCRAPGRGQQAGPGFGRDSAIGRAITGAGCVSVSAEHAEGLNSSPRDPLVRGIFSSTGGQTVLSYVALVGFHGDLVTCKPPRDGAVASRPARLRHRRPAAHGPARTP